MISTQDAQLTPASIVTADDEAAHTTNRPSHLINTYTHSHRPRSPRQGWSLANASFQTKALASVGLLLAFGPTGAEARTGGEIAEM